MIVDKINLVTAQSEREERILRDVMHHWWPINRRPDPDGEWRPTAEFRMTDEELRKAIIEVAKTDEQRLTEWRAMRAQGR